MTCSRGSLLSVDLGINMGGIQLELKSNDKIEGSADDESEREIA